MLLMEYIIRRCEPFTSMWPKAAAAFVFCLGMSVQLVAARSAEISVRSTDGLIAVVLIEGEFSRGDNDVFVQKVLSFKHAMVVFDSPGGNLLAGLEIGRAVRLKGFETYVPAGSFCSSACALAWLGGTSRFISRTGRIGFHAAYNAEAGFARESGMGNALVGAYLNSLGLSANTIAYMTMASPDSMVWLTLQDAQKLGLNVELLDLDDVATGPSAGSQRTAPPVVTSESQPNIASTSERIGAVQRCLKGFNYYRGPLNGILDYPTSNSIKRFQEAWGMRVTGAVTDELLKKCGLF